MPTITFNLPEGALSALRLSPTEFVKEMRVAAALLWYSHGELSQSKAAEIAGTSRAEFIDELAHRRIPVVQVTAEELVLIETYLSRRFELDPDVRLRTAIQIAERIKAKTGLQPQSHQHVDDFLEDAARRVRDSGRFRS